MVQFAWPSLFHSSGVRTSTMMVLPDLVVSDIEEDPSAMAGVAAAEFSVEFTFVVGELHATA